MGLGWVNHAFKFWAAESVHINYDLCFGTKFDILVMCCHPFREAMNDQHFRWRLVILNQFSQIFRTKNK